MYSRVAENIFINQKNESQVAIRNKAFGIKLSAGG